VHRGSEAVLDEHLKAVVVIGAFVVMTFVVQRGSEDVLDEHLKAVVSAGGKYSDFCVVTIMGMLTILVLGGLDCATGLNSGILNSTIGLGYLYPSFDTSLLVLDA
jgi:hypothetical protein